MMLKTGQTLLLTLRELQRGGLQNIFWIPKANSCSLLQSLAISIPWNGFQVFFGRREG
jgi:hypothetical protein